MAFYEPGLKVGYLGGGQLARMLAQSASRLGLLPAVLSENADDPAAQVTNHWMQGKLSDAQSLIGFLDKLDVATFESEFLDADLLKEAATVTGCAIYPSPHLMGTLQDRKTQKAWLDEYDLPNAPWAAVESDEQILEFQAAHGLPLVFKKRSFGYDGYGTFIISSEKQLETFVSETFQPDSFIVEKAMTFKKEVAVIIARSRDGSFTHFPFVESHQEDARCDWIQGPIPVPNEKKWLARLENFLHEINYVGVMGVEFFALNDGLAINEIAPRVHNTGHYTESSHGLSQFDLHNMCLLGQKLPEKIKMKHQGFAMANLIGQGKKTKLAAVPGLHWYGKKENRQGRKMGHINAYARDGKKALQKALERRGKIQL